MIDPTDVTKFDRTDAELQEWWLFGTVVAGKTAATQARLLDALLTDACEPGQTPFEMIRALMGKGEGMMFKGTPIKSPLEHFMRRHRIGQYGRLLRCWEESVALDLRNDPIEAFEAIHGIGPKTARMFVMHSRPAQRVAAIDTHVLKYLKANGHTAPKATPPAGKLYRALEDAFLKLADASGMSVADFDLMIWKSYAK